MRFRGAAPVYRVLDLARRRFPRTVRSAERALNEVLEAVAGSAWPEVAWRFSRINGDGFPVEFTFSSVDQALRYTAEVAGPELAERARFARALRWTGETRVERWLRARVARWQPGSLRFGAWIGGAHTENGERRKIYVETESAPGLPSDFSVPSAASLRFIGMTDGGRELEWYFRKDLLEAAELGRLLRGTSLAGFYAPLSEAIAATLPWPSRDCVIPTAAGFSIAPDRAVSVFTYARRLWGGDLSIRRALLDLADRHGWDFGLYEEVTRPLESATGYLTSHGILAWIAAPRRPVELRIMLRPPAATTAT